VNNARVVVNIAPVEIVVGQVAFIEGAWAGAAVRRIARWDCVVCKFAHCGSKDGLIGQNAKASFILRSVMRSVTDEGRLLCHIARIIDETLYEPIRPIALAKKLVNSSLLN